MQSKAPSPMSLFGRQRILAVFWRPQSSGPGGGKNLYAVLGVAPQAEAREIKESFYRLSKEHHPDISTSDSSIERFREIAEAYETLSNPEKRKQYDLEHPVKARQSVRRPPGRKFEGMKGTFRNGEFVDEDPTPQMRNIQYDLSPERMERVWARYKSRWERVEEVERERELERRKEEFRRRVDEKRERMGSMSVEEREDFLFKLRQLRPDAGEPSSEQEKVEWERRSREREEERSGREREERERRRRGEEERKQEQKQWAKDDARAQNAAYEEWNFDEGVGKDQRGTHHAEPGSKTGADDPIWAGLNSSKDAGDFGSFARKTSERHNDKWGWVRGAKVDDRGQTSDRYGIEGKRGFSVGEWALVLLCGSIPLLAWGELADQWGGGG